MMPHIYLAGEPYSMYSFCYVLSLLTGSVPVSARRRVFGIAKRDLRRILWLVALGVILGGKLVYAIGNILMYGSEPGFWTDGSWTYILQGNIFYGSFLGAAGLALLYAKRRKIPIGNLTDLMACFVPAGHVVARLGCFFEGCCYGIEVQHMFTIPGTIYAEPRLPWPLLEVGLNLLILFTLLLWRPERRHPGTAFPLYLIMYSAGRFVLDFFRAAETRGPYLIFSVSMSQWVALALIIVSSIVLYRIHKVDNAKELG